MSSLDDIKYSIEMVREDLDETYQLMSLMNTTLTKIFEVLNEKGPSKAPSSKVEKIDWGGNSH